MTTDADEVFRKMLDTLIEAIAAADEVAPDHLVREFKAFTDATAPEPLTDSQRRNAHMIFMAGAISVIRVLVEPLRDFRATKDVPMQAEALQRMMKTIDTLNGEARQHAKDILDLAIATRDAKG
jgi:hypothetical protein